MNEKQTCPSSRTPCKRQKEDAHKGRAETTQGCVGKGEGETVAAAAHHNFRDLTGRKFGRLTVVSFNGRHQKRQGFQWNCSCECGGQKVVFGSDLTCGSVSSCGCLLRETASSVFRTHGLSLTVEHIIWKGMKQRCLNPKDVGYADYGGRGITICDRWLKFENFIADILASLGPRPDGMSIDRINTDGNYEPGNVRWATRIQQARNKRNNLVLTHNGETRCAAEWAKRTGIPVATLYKRIEMGWSAADTLSRIPDRNRRRFSKSRPAVEPDRQFFLTAADHT